MVTHYYYGRERKKSEYVNVQKAIRLLMKNELKEQCSKYIDQGWIYEDELECLVAMHAVYHDTLKGNGFLDSLMHKVNDLEVKIHSS